MKEHALIEIAAWSSAEERYAKIVQPLDAMLQESGVGRVDGVVDKFCSSEHFLSGSVSYTDAIRVELCDLNVGLRQLETALKTLRVNCSISFSDQGRDGISLIHACED
jgi:hypothetical protein